MFYLGSFWRLIPRPGVYVVTTNSITKSSGALVMGRGSAGDLAKRVPGIDVEIAKQLRDEGFHLRGSEFYGFRMIRQPSSSLFGIAILQAKRDWKTVSRFEDIKNSLAQFRDYAVSHPETNFRSVVPGWGCGQIGRGAAPSRERIIKTILSLSFPDNVTFVVRSGDGALPACAFDK